MSYTESSTGAHKEFMTVDETSATNNKGSHTKEGVNAQQVTENIILETSTEGFMTTRVSNNSLSYLRKFLTNWVNKEPVLVRSDR